MSIKLKGIVYLLLFVRFVAVVWEMVSVNVTLGHLKQGDTGFRPGSSMHKMAMDTDMFFKNQIEACNLRLDSMFQETKCIFLYALVIGLILNSKVRQKMVKISRERLSFLDPESPPLMLFVLAIAASELYTKRPMLVSTIYILPQVAYPLNIVILLLIEIPCLVYLSMRLLAIFKKNFILSCYAAFLISDTIEIFRNEISGEDRLVRIPSNIFPEKLQSLLSSQGLKNSIYRSRLPKRRRNASLVGFGESRRIEIYGDFDIKNSKVLHSVILHEIGHSVDNTILKRKILKYALFLCEMALMLWIYTNGDKRFGCADISAEGFLIMMVTTYLVSGRPLVFVIFNIYTQNSELFADRFAKANGYGDPLSQALFRIALEHSVTINPSFLFHAMTSLHPSTLSRIEACGG